MSGPRVSSAYILSEDIPVNSPRLRSVADYERSDPGIYHALGELFEAFESERYPWTDNLETFGAVVGQLKEAYDIRNQLCRHVYHVRKGRAEFNSKREENISRLNKGLENASAAATQLQDVGPVTSKASCAAKKRKLQEVEAQLKVANELTKKLKE